MNDLPQARVGFLSTFIKWLPARHWLCLWPEGARVLMAGSPSTSQFVPRGSGTREAWRLPAVSVEGGKGSLNVTHFSF